MIDIIAVTYNQLPYLRQSLFNLKRNAGIPCKVTIVSDGATDGTNEWLKSEEAKPFYDKLIIKENGGVSSAFNCGIVSSNNDIIVTHMCDYVCPPNWLGDLQKAWETKKFDLISHAIKYIVANVDEKSPLYDWSELPHKFEWQHPKEFDLKKCVHIADKIYVLPIPGLGNNSMISNRNLYRKVGLYTEFGSYGQNDTEFFLRCKKLKLRFGIISNYCMHCCTPVGIEAKLKSAAINKRRMLSGDFTALSYEDCVKKYSHHGEQL